jgi:hypothetical protein
VIFLKTLNFKGQTAIMPNALTPFLKIIFSNRIFKIAIFKLYFLNHKPKRAPNFTDLIVRI